MGIYLVKSSPPRRKRFMLKQIVFALVLPIVGIARRPSSSGFPQRLPPFCIPAVLKVTQFIFQSAQLLKRIFCFSGSPAVSVCFRSRLGSVFRYSTSSSKSSRSNDVLSDALLADYATIFAEGGASRSKRCSCERTFEAKGVGRRSCCLFNGELMGVPWYILMGHALLAHLGFKAWRNDRVSMVGERILLVA